MDAEQPAAPRPPEDSLNKAAESSERVPWTRSRYGLAAFWFVSLVAVWFLLRVILFFQFKPAHALFSDSVMVFLSGLHRDIFVALLFTLPLLAWMYVVPNRWFGKLWHRILFTGACFVFGFGHVFLLFVEYFFFAEFKSRFNTVAVDYLLFPYEVFVNIWESYHVAIVLVICLVLTSAWTFLAWRLFRRKMWERPFRAWTRFGIVAGTTVAVVLLTRTLDLKGAHVSEDRTMNQLASNDALCFFDAAWTHDLDYKAFYKTISLSEAYRRTRKLLVEPDTKFTGQGESIRRAVAGDPTRPRLNVVILLEESLGSEFWGSLGREGGTLTPHLDKIAGQQGMLFTNIYACGNRTVRGMEGVLSSFPPLPGDSIVRRDMSDNVETVARVLKRDGYSTFFLYGGRGLFDDMRSFSLKNGYDRFIEEKDFTNITFKTIWGACDEDLYRRGIEEMRALSDKGKPFFATLLTVSNHQPYTYPKGRIPEDPDRHWRIYAVQYADYALGKFFQEAEKQPFWTNTIFALVADHGARVYGSQDIPIHSYEIPLLIVGPAVVKAPSRIGTLGSSLDVSPTILGLIGRPYTTMFFGHNLLDIPPQDGRAFLNHDRDIGMLMHKRMAVLGLQKTLEIYQGNPKKVKMTLVPRPDASDVELEKNAIAVFQVANDLYTHYRYRIDSAPPITSTPAVPPGQRPSTLAGAKP
jgi:phosphoglycerol transferase MdoB-like AlkP superfamily enzyme